MILAEPAPAKLNLTLTIVGRRPDGYHRLDSLFVFVACADRLSYAPATDLELAVEGPFAEGLGGSDNLVVKAAALLAAEAGLRPAGRLLLQKHVPVAAGVGGGSADAAAALRLLNRAWDLDWPEDRLTDLAGRLGADIPACVSSRPVIARETGEALTPAPDLPPCGVLLVNPRVPTPTPAVFKRYRDLNPAITPPSIRRCQSASTISPRSSRRSRRAATTCCRPRSTSARRSGKRSRHCRPCHASPMSAFPAAARPASRFSRRRPTRKRRGNVLQARTTGGAGRVAGLTEPTPPDASRPGEELDGAPHHMPPEISIATPPPTKATARVIAETDVMTGTPRM